VGWSGSGIEDGAVQSRPGDSKACGYFSNRDVGSLEQCPDGLDLFGGEFGGMAAFSTASTRRFKASNGGFPDQITFEFGERRKDMKDQLSGWRARFYFLRQRFEVDSAGFQFTAT
jgi:hypothetical protein